VEVLNGTVSRVYYELEPDVFLGWPASNFVVVRSTYAFWADRRRPIPVRSADDENPAFRFGVVSGEFSTLSGRDNSIGVAYTPDAAHDLVSHAFQVDLSCFWGLRGCDSVRQMATPLWQDRKRIEEAAEAPLKSHDPCPDWILAGRVRTLPDLNVALLEVANSTGDFRLKEAIRGKTEGPGPIYRSGIPSPDPAPGSIGSPMQINRKVGDRFLYFTGANFNSCRIVPATPSAESAVRTAIHAPRRTEDDIGWIFGRL
jgi:hypothetical protein